MLFILLLNQYDRSNLGFGDQTLTIVTADHGESMVEHDLYFDHPFLYEDIVKIPLIFHCPSKIPKGKLVSDLVNHTDIVPTVLSLLGISIPSSVDGVSLLPKILGETNQNRTLCITNNGWGIQRAWRTGRWKLIENLSKGHLGTPNGWIELYNVERDPEEKVNLTAVEMELAKDLRSELHKWVETQLNGKQDPQFVSRFQKPKW
jgi:arylsulfatase A-like enzyme